MSVETHVAALVKQMQGTTLADLRLGGVYTPSAPGEFVLDRYAVFLCLDEIVMRFEALRDDAKMSIQAVGLPGVSSRFSIDEGDVVLSFTMLENFVVSAPCRVQRITLWNVEMMDGTLVVDAAELGLGGERLFVDPCYYWGLRFGGPDVRADCFDNRPNLANATETVLELE